MIEFPDIKSIDTLDSTLKAYHEKLSDEMEVHFFAVCSQDMEEANISEILNNYPNLSVVFSEHHSKVINYNRCISEDVPFDIVLLADENVKPKVFGYDKYLIEEYTKAFPNFDGVLNIPNGTDSQKVNQLPILGKNYVQQQGNIFPQVYSEIKYAKKEFTYVSRILAKEKISGLKLFSVIETSVEDDLMDDKDLFDLRSESNFFISEEFYKALFPKRWSILICTLEERKKQFNFIYKKLENQIKALNLKNEIEILYMRDNREMRLGEKRNELIRRAKGRYVNFIDDDDDVHDDYIKMIYNNLAKNPDCVSLKGIVTFNGNNPKYFIHSLKYTDYFERDNIYYRPPNHLNTMKRSIASRFLFPGINYGEDNNWAYQVLNERAIKTEAEVNIPYYFYQYQDK